MEKKQLMLSLFILVYALIFCSFFNMQKVSTKGMIIGVFLLVFLVLLWMGFFIAYKHESITNTEKEKHKDTDLESENDNN